jgi:FkbM family methyltransferase
LALKHYLARAFVSALPSDVGLWRLKRFLPACPDPSRPIIRKLRGYPLQLTFKPGTYLGWHIYYRGVYEEGVLRTCAGLLRDGMSFVDVGANVGLYSVIAASVVGSRGSVIAFEPQPELAKMIEENARLNRLDNIIVKNCALGASSGEASLYQVSRTNDGAATLQVGSGEAHYGEPLTVPVRRLSEMLQEHGIANVGGIKIDVEGAELQVLEGFADSLAAAPPEFILVECIDKHLRRFGGTRDALLSFLWQAGYQLACRYRSRWRRLTEPEDHDRFGCSPDVLAVRPSTPAWDLTTKWLIGA